MEVIKSDELTELQQQEQILWKRHSLSSELEKRLRDTHEIDIEGLIKACGILPWNYNYEIPKTIDKIMTA